MNSLIKRTITGGILLALLWLFFFYLPAYFLTLALCLVLLEILLIEWPRLVSPHTAAFWLITPLYPILPFVLLIALNQAPYQPVLFALFILVPIFDTGSYFIGKTFGKRTIAPSISPGKTWEGFCGGLITLFISISLLDRMHHNVYHYAFLTIAIAILALSGDLFESWFKRRAQVKDSGALLPGHGGFLDRFDSILFTVFFFYCAKDYILALIMQ